MALSFHESFQKRLKREHKKVLVQSFFINSALLYYFMAASIAWFRGFVMEESEWFPVSLRWTLLPVIAVWGSFWSSRKNSPGAYILSRTNALMKATRGQREASEPLETGFNWTFAFQVALQVVTFLFGWFITEMSFESLFSEQGIQGAKRIFVSLFSPNMGILNSVLTAMLQTVFIAFMATAIAIPFAFLLSFFCSRNLTKDSSFGRVSYVVLRMLFNLTRSVEPLIWAIIFSVWVGIGPFAGMLALMLHSVSSLAKLYSEQIESINEGPLEAIEATGANRVQVIWYAVVPQVIMPFLSYTIYRWDINIRMATVIGLVGGGGVGTLLMQYQGLARWNEVGTIVLVIAIVVWLMDYLSARIREAIY